MTLAAGTAVAPALAFDGDSDCGLFRAEADQIGLATAGVQRLLLSSTTLSVAVGLNFTPTGAFDRSAAASGVTRGALGFYAPAGATGGQGIYGGGMFFGRADASTRRKAAIAAVQTGSDLNQMGLMFLTYGGTSTSTDLVSPRLLLEHGGGVRFNAQNLYAGATLDPLPSADGHLILHRGNILGTASQSAGVPTGAVIERGSNANGEYTRFADGSQVCNRSLVASVGGATNWTFPAAFAAAPVVSGAAVAAVLSVVVLETAPTATAASFSARDKADARRADTCHLLAIGRWF